MSGAVSMITDPRGTINAIDRAIIDDTGLGGRMAGAVRGDIADMASGDPARIERGFESGGLKVANVLSLPTLTLT